MYQNRFWQDKSIERQPNLTVYVNGIWFSPDGTIPDVVFATLSESILTIKDSSYANQYKVILWCDKSKIKDPAAIMKQLDEFGLEEDDIEIKDYHEVSPSPEDTDSIKLNRWVDEFVKAGNNEFKIAYAMASDMFRMYLLLKEYPSRPDSIGCYIDCNDIYLEEIPNPVELRRQSLLIDSLEMGFPPNLPITSNRNHLKMIVNNDIIVTGGLSTSLYNQIFAAYCSNLDQIDRATGGLRDCYVKTLNEAGELDEATVYAMVFGSTHSMSTLFTAYNKDGFHEIYLITRRDNHVLLQPLNGVKPVNRYLPHCRVDTQGQTWQPDTLNTSSLDTKPLALSWQQFFILNQSLIQAYSTLRKANISADSLSDKVKAAINQWGREGIIGQSKLRHLVNFATKMQTLDQRKPETAILIEALLTYPAITDNEFMLLQNIKEEELKNRLLQTIMNIAYGENLFDKVLKRKDEGLMSALIEGKCRPNYRESDVVNKDGYDYVSLAILNDFPIDIIKNLLPITEIWAMPAYFSISQPNYHSPLRVAIEKGNEAAVKLLISHGARPEIIPDPTTKENAYDVAKRCNNANILNILNKRFNNDNDDNDAHPGQVPS